MHMLGMLAVTVALVPAPKEQVWRDGTCAVAEADVRYVRDAALPRGTADAQQRVPPVVDATERVPPCRAER